MGKESRPAIVHFISIVVVGVARTVALTVAPCPLAGGLIAGKAVRGGGKGGRHRPSGAAADDGHHNAEDDGANEKDEDSVENDQRKGEQHIGVGVDGGVPPAEPAAQATKAAAAASVASFGGGVDWRCAD